MGAKGAKETKFAADLSTHGKVVQASLWGTRRRLPGRTGWFGYAEGLYIIVQVFKAEFVMAPSSSKPIQL